MPSPQRRGIEVGIVKGSNFANQDPKSDPKYYRSQSYPTLIHFRFCFCYALSLQQNGEHVFTWTPGTKIQNLGSVRLSHGT